MKKTFSGISVVLLCLTMSFSTFAHSGRTDAQGGHHDYKNASGLGSYHYHHGYPAHLHTNGICPYDKQPQQTSTPAKIETTSTTDIKAYINNTFIPSVNYKDSTYIIAEDLSNYGYDVAWHAASRTLKIKRNDSIQFKSSATDNPTENYEIEPSDIQTYLYIGNDYKLLNSYNIGGKTIIKLSDLGNVQWENQSRTSHLSI